MQLLTLIQNLCILKVIRFQVLLVNEWRPQSCCVNGSKMSNGKLRTYPNECDLIIHYDTDISPSIGT